MKARVRNDRINSIINDDGWEDSFESFMCSNRVLTFEKREGNKNWYVCLSNYKAKGENVSLKGFRYHISWLVPVEENENP